ncbi:unnamed protein product [Rhodiola kirilowii]
MRNGKSICLLKRSLQSFWNLCWVSTLHRMESQIWIGSTWLLCIVMLGFDKADSADSILLINDLPTVYYLRLLVAVVVERNNQRRNPIQGQNG